MRRSDPGLAVRLLAAQLVVAVAAIFTAWVVATAIGPSIFHDHLTRVAPDASSEKTMTHAEQAYREANTLAVGAGLLGALLVAVCASLWVTRRVAGPVSALARAAEDVADGRYAVHVPRAGLGREFDMLAGSFVTMAARLDGVEATRRRLLGDLAHEMRTPVATLDAYLEGIEDGVATLDPATIGMLRSQTRRLARLSEDVASVSRAEEHQLDLHTVLVSPAHLVSAAAAAAADRYAAAGVALRTQVPPGLPEVDVDLDRLGQVLGNLLDNALRHTPAGGAVTIACTPVTFDETGGGASTGAVQLTVTDTGAGISPAHLPHVFERFYRVDAARDRAHGGSGIGLAIVKAVVEAHGGRVTARSPGPGAGATFQIVLPVAGENGSALPVRSSP